MRALSWRWALLPAVLLPLCALLAWSGLSGRPDPWPARFPCEAEYAPTVARLADPEFSAEGLRFCGRTESITEAATFRPWPDRRITWAVRVPPELAGVLPADKVREAFRAAWASWAAGIDIEPVETDEASALVRSKFGTIDQPGRVLAWSELSDGTRTPKHQLYDLSEPWVVSDTPPANRIDLTRVAAHEIGHVLGLVHDDEGSGSLMAPTYSRAVGRPLKRDIERAVALGYKPAKVPGPVPNGPRLTPNAISFTVPVTIPVDDLADALKRAGYRVEK